MPVHQLDVIVRVAGATLLLLAAAYGRRVPGAASRHFVCLAICLCGFLAGNSPDPQLRLEGPLAYPAVLLAGCTAVALWWYCLAVFDRTFQPRGAVLVCGITWILLASADRRLFGPSLADMELSRVLVPLGVGMMVHVAWRVLRDRDGDLLEERRRTRRLVVIALAGQLGADLAIDVVMGLDWRPPALPVLQNTLLLLFVCWLLRIQLGVRAVPAAPPAEDGSSASGVTQATGAPAVVPVPEDPGLARLRYLMDVERLYLDPELTLPQFVRAMGASERTVRRLIHEELGHDHFRTFLNTYRVAEARRLLMDPTRRHEKLIAVALASGFASVPTFNRVFKEIDGQPPSAFRAGVQRGVAPPAGAGIVVPPAAGAAASVS